MNNPKNAGMQKMTDKVMRDGKSPVSQKTPEYIEFQNDSTKLKSKLSSDKEYINKKYRPFWSHESSKFLDQAAHGFEGKKYETTDHPHYRLPTWSGPHPSPSQPPPTELWEDSPTPQRSKDAPQRSKDEKIIKAVDKNKIKKAKRIIRRYNKKVDRKS